MKVRDLRKALEGVPDDLLVVRPGSDHSFLHLYYATEVEAEKNEWGLNEYYDPNGLSEGATKVTVFLIGDG